MEASIGKLGGQVAVITGGSSGSGFAAARLFAKEGAEVVITGRHQKEERRCQQSTTHTTTSDWSQTRLASRWKTEASRSSPPMRWSQRASSLRSPATAPRFLARLRRMISAGTLFWR